MHSQETGRLSHEDLETCLLAAGWPPDSINATIETLCHEHLDKHEDETYSPTNWDEYAGRLMDMRRRWKEQKQKQRDRGKAPAPPAAKPSPKPQPKAELPGTSSLDESFDEVWKIYPRKKGKTMALRKWRRMSQADRELLAKVIVPFAAKWKGALPDRMKYCPHGSTWFNKELWRDDLQDTLADVDRVAKDGNSHEQVDEAFAEPPRFGGP
jgi:hypothetical protein